MVPSAYVVLDTLPLTSNGKVDRKALPVPDGSALSVKEYAAPQGQIEERLAEIWQELLHVERVGRHDNFFELGGHSLLATRARAALNQEFLVDVPLLEFMQSASLRELAPVVAGYLEKSTNSADAILQKIRLIEALTAAELEEIVKN
jgi:hypothetical protein